MIRLLSLFTGIGAFEKALKMLNIRYELVGFSEIDKFAVKSYCAIHNVDENKNLGDVKNIKTENLKEVDFMTWGFPCQDVSIAGNLKGIEEGKTRSGLYFEGYRILKDVMPKVSIIENVKNLTSKRFREKFVKILKDIEDAGYNNYWRILNAKDYGVPQNRERVFVVSIRKDIDKCSFNFPDKQFLKIRLKDLLEDNVDEKYYLSEKAIGRLIRHSNKIITKKENPNVSSCLVAGYFKMGARDEQYIKDDNSVRRITGIFDSENKTHQAGSIYDDKGLAPTLTSASGGNIQPHILVREGTKAGVTKATIGDSINISYPNNIKKRGRVGKQVSQTILASNNNMATLEKTNIKNITMFNPYNNSRIEDIAPTQTAHCGAIYSSAAVLISEDGEYCFRIRKLTPKECWRLMGFQDEDFEKARSIGMSDTQLYKQAGNSIVVNVLVEIFKKLIFEDSTSIKFL
ncbi:MAG: DNA (cytosine-5-)-methyltransferase [Clostridia bacterium]|nr:DNA (cytosine-5-)-methyltransferase [Clostridia bacterium]